MDIILLDHRDSAATLTLEPAGDTIFILTGGLSETVLELCLQKEGVRAFLVGLFRTENEERFVIHQRHLAPQTESHVLLKTVVMEDGNFFYQGNLHIEANAHGTVASQEVRGLLLSENSRFKAVPALEIIPSDVVCKHKASSAPLNKDSLFTLQTKGLSLEEAQNVLEKAFLKSAFDLFRGFGISEEDITKVQSYFPALYG